MTKSPGPKSPGGPKSPDAARHTRVKRRAVAALLVGVAVWPLLHHGFVRATGANPWRLFGWAMYATPEPVVEVSVELRRHGSTLGRPLSKRARDLRDRFAARRSSFGRAATGESLGRAILAAEPHADQVEVAIRTWRLDRTTARLRIDEERRVFPRQGR